LQDKLAAMAYDHRLVNMATLMTLFNKF